MLPDILLLSVFVEQRPGQQDAGCIKRCRIKLPRKLSRTRLDLVLQSSDQCGFGGHIKQVVGALLCRTKSEELLPSTP